MDIEPPGLIGEALRRDLKRLKEDLERPSSLAAAAISAARILDDPETPARDFATVMRAFQATVQALEARGGRDAGQDILSGVLAPVGDAPEPGAADPRP